MRRMKSTALLAYGLLLILAAMTGCSLWNRTQDSGSSGGALAGATGSSTARQKTPDELPPKETAKLCVATAEEMQKQGHPDQAIFLLEKARENDPSLPKIAHHLALLYDAQGDGTRALSEYQKALAATPKVPDLLNDFGYYHYRRGDLAEAEKLYRQVLSISPKHKMAQTNLAIILGHQRRYQESIELFTKVVGPAAAHSNVGVIMAEQGDYDMARQAFVEASRLDGTLQQPKAFLAYLDQRQSKARPDLQTAAQMQFR